MKEYLPFLLLPFAFFGLTKAVGKPQRECYICGKTTNDYEIFQVDYPRNYQPVCESCAEPFENRLMKTEGINISTEGLSIDQVITAWKNNEPARTTNLITDGKNLYSYALKIGFTGEDGGKYVYNYTAHEDTDWLGGPVPGLFKSVTTSRHVSLARIVGYAVTPPELVKKESEDENEIWDVEEEMKTEGIPKEKKKKKVKLYGILKTSERCPHCLRGLLDNNMCLIHGYIKEPMDLLTAPEDVKLKAVDIAFLNFFERRHVMKKKYTIDDLHNEMGVDKDFAVTYLNSPHVDNEKGETAKDYYERIYSIKIETNMETKGTDSSSGKEKNAEEETLPGETFEIDKYKRDHPQFKQRLFRVWQHKDGKWEEIFKLPMRYIVPNTGLIYAGVDVPVSYWDKTKTYYTTVGVEL